jgi:hypothetical protein
LPGIAPRFATTDCTPSRRIRKIERYLDDEQARHRFDVFVQQAWHVLEPQTPFVNGIHFQAMCEHLQALAEGRIKNLNFRVTRPTRGSTA